MLLDLIKECRTYRRYKGDAPVGAEKLYRYIDGARLSASALNAQRLRFAPVYEPELVEAMYPLSVFGGALTPEQRARADQHPTAFVVICSDTDFSKAGVDVGIAAQSIVLAAAEDGVGSCMLRSFSPDKVRALLSLPEEQIPHLVIALGYPDERVEICEGRAGALRYFRDENDTHMVPKLPLDEVILK